MRQTSVLSMNYFLSVAQSSIIRGNGNDSTLTLPIIRGRRVVTLDPRSARVHLSTRGGDANSIVRGRSPACSVLLCVESIVESSGPSAGLKSFILSCMQPIARTDLVCRSRRADVLDRSEGEKLVIVRDESQVL